MIRKVPFPSSYNAHSHLFNRHLFIYDDVNHLLKGAFQGRFLPILFQERGFLATLRKKFKREPDSKAKVVYRVKIYSTDRVEVASQQGTAPIHLTAMVFVKLTVVVKLFNMGIRKRNIFIGSPKG